MSQKKVFEDTMCTGKYHCFTESERIDYEMDEDTILRPLSKAEIKGLSYRDVKDLRYLRGIIDSIRDCDSEYIEGGQDE